jgi:type IV secretory pathway protease TraF
MARSAMRWTVLAPWRTRSNVALSMLLMMAVVSTYWVRLNVSPSVPYGLYWLTAVHTPLSLGTLVVLPVPAVVRPWWSTWWIPLLKPVAALAGDEVCVEEGWLRVGGNWIGPVYTQAHGMPLPQWQGCQRVPEGAVFLASGELRALDGRYWGMTPVATLTAQAIPLFTWRTQ